VIRLSNSFVAKFKTELQRLERNVETYPVLEDGRSLNLRAHRVPMKLAIEEMLDALKYDLIRELLPEVLPNTRISLAEPKIVENNS
jgi:hypothetical protein